MTGGRLSVFSSVVQFDHAACALLLRIDDTGIKRTRVYVQTHCSLIEFAGIVDPVKRFYRINGAGLMGIHFDRIRGFDLVSGMFQILREYVIVYDAQSSDRNCHTASLLALIVA